jgi:light-regulated signal transduction histidine kinase (bacteriophytochrome)
LISQNGERQVTVRIEDSMVVGGNIDLGHTSVDDELVYYGRDNGVGFDIVCADELFSLVRRLHRTGEFAGSA